MVMTLHSDLRSVAGSFDIPGEFQSVEPFGNGHINDTYRAVFVHRDRAARYILQRINHRVFKNPIALMENVERVTSHLATQVADISDKHRRVLTLIRARDGAAYYKDGESCFWRAYCFIENTTAYDAVESPRHAFQAAKAFGRFQHLLAGLRPAELNETIADFHHTPKRFEALERAIAADVEGRASRAKAEIDFALARQSINRILIEAGLPQRVTHNDAKFNNVLLDAQTGEGICVIDLDTVMPGLAPYDFGDIVRTTTSPTREDERDLSQVTMQFPMFEALVRGYLESAGGFLTKAERRYLSFSGKLITFEIGIRFLTDFIAGDTYFKVHRRDHNLDRCRTQFRLVRSIEQQEEKMDRLVESLA